MLLSSVSRSLETQITGCRQARTLSSLIFYGCLGGRVAAWRYTIIDSLCFVVRSAPERLYQLLLSHHRRRSARSFPPHVLRGPEMFATRKITLTSFTKWLGIFLLTSIVVTERELCLMTKRDT